MQDENARLAVTLAAIGVSLALFGVALGSGGVSLWGWAAYLVGGVLWVTAALGLGDADSRKFLAGTLRKSTYTQIYTTLTRRLLTPLWNRYCDPVPERTWWPGQFRAALTWRLYDRALLIAFAYPGVLLAGQWAVTGDDGNLGSEVVLPSAQFFPERATFFAILLILFVGSELERIWISTINNYPAIAVSFLKTLFGVFLGVALFFDAMLGERPILIICAFGFAIFLAFRASGLFEFAFGFIAGVGIIAAMTLPGVLRGTSAFAVLIACLVASAVIILSDRLAKKIDIRYHESS